MEVQFGLSHVWQQGDWIARGVALMLFAMSVITWSVIVLKAAQLWRCRRQLRNTSVFWQARDPASGLEHLTDPGHPLRRLVEEGVRANSQLLQLKAGRAPDVSEWLARALHHGMEEVGTRLQSGLAWLASIGATAPFIGLFGTVWGIYHALLGIGMAGEASIDQVAGPIGEALIMTALGLAVAIPAVLSYNALLRANKALLHDLNRAAHDLHGWFVTGVGVVPAKAAAGQGTITHTAHSAGSLPTAASA